MGDFMSRNHTVNYYRRAVNGEEKTKWVESRTRAHERAAQRGWDEESYDIESKREEKFHTFGKPNL
jgi:hypothetical protein